MVQQTALTSLAERQRQRRQNSHSLRSVHGQAPLPPGQDALAAPTGSHKPLSLNNRARATENTQHSATSRPATSHATLVVQTTTIPTTQSYHVQRHLPERGHQQAVQRPAEHTTGHQVQPQVDQGQHVQHGNQRPRARNATPLHAPKPQPSVSSRQSRPQPSTAAIQLSQAQLPHTNRQVAIDQVQPSAHSYSQPLPAQTTPPYSQPSYAPLPTRDGNPANTMANPPSTMPLAHLPAYTSAPSTATTWAAGFRIQPPLELAASDAWVEAPPVWVPASPSTNWMSHASATAPAATPPLYEPMVMLTSHQMKPMPRSPAKVLHVEVDASMHLVAADKQADSESTPGRRPYPHGRAHVVSVPVPLDPEEERRRVRRRHRKRLAALVVEHWKWFARYRLMGLRADRHYRQQLVGAALVGLQSNVVAAHASWRLAAVHRARGRHLLMAAMMQEWRSWSQCQGWLRGVGQRLAASHHNRVRRHVLRAWAQWRQQHVRHRKQDMQAMYYYTFVTLTKCVREWRHGVTLHQHYVDLAYQAQAHAARGCLFRALRGWQEGLRRCRAKAKQAAAASDWHRYQRLSSTLHGWCAAVSLVRAGRTQAVAALQAAVSAWCMQKTGQALRVWLAISQRRRVLATVAVRVVHAGQATRQRSCMAAWRAWVRRERELRLAAGVLAPLGRQWRLGVCWSALRRAVDVAQGARNAEMRRLVLARATLGTLAVYAHHRQRQRELQSAWGAAMGRMWRRAWLREWWVQAHRLRLKALRWHAAEDAHRAHLLRSAITGWSARVAYTHAKAQRWLQAISHHRALVLHVSFRAWSHYYSWRVLKRDVSAWARRGLACAVLQAWCAHTREQLNEARRWQAAGRHRYLGLLSGGMHALRLAVARRAAKRALWSRSALHHAHSLLLRAVLAWAHTFLPMAAEQRARAARAARHWRMRVLRSAFTGWQAESVRLALKHGREAEADVFARACLLGRSLMRWVLGLGVRRERRLLKTSMLDAARRVLGRKRAGRVLAAWHDVHVHKMLKGFQHARAVAHRVCACQRAVWAVWQMAVQRARWRALQAARASHHWAQHCVGLVWPAWQSYVLHRRGKARAQHVARRHANAVLCRCALHGLRWYVSYRHRKAADLSAALELHTQLLRREGAVQWLRVGTWRRTHRLQHRAHTQARALAIELAMVEPYARHWQRVTRERTAARLAAFQAAALASRPLPAQLHGSHAPLLLNAQPLPPSWQRQADARSPTPATPWHTDSGCRLHPAQAAITAWSSQQQVAGSSSSGVTALNALHGSPSHQHPALSAPPVTLWPVQATPAVQPATPTHMNKPWNSIDEPTSALVPAASSMLGSQVSSATPWVQHTQETLQRPAGQGGQSPHVLSVRAGSGAGMPAHTFPTAAATPMRRQRAAPRMPAFLVPAGTPQSLNASPSQPQKPSHTSGLGNSLQQKSTPLHNPAPEQPGNPGSDHVKCSHPQFGGPPWAQSGLPGKPGTPLHQTALQLRDCYREQDLVINTSASQQQQAMAHTSAVDDGELLTLEAQMQHLMALKQHLHDLEAEAARLVHSQGAFGGGGLVAAASLAAVLQRANTARIALAEARPAVTAAAQRVQQLKGCQPGTPI